MSEALDNKKKLPKLPHPEEVFTRSQIFVIESCVRLFNNKILRVFISVILSLVFSNLIFIFDAWIDPDHEYVFPNLAFPVFFLWWAFAFYHVIRFLIKNHFIALDFVYRRFLHQRGEDLEALVDLERCLQFARSASEPEFIVNINKMHIDEQRVAWKKMQEQYVKKRSDWVKSLEFESFVGRWYGLEIPQREIGMPPFP